MYIKKRNRSDFVDHWDEISRLLEEIYAFKKRAKSIAEETKRGRWLIDALVSSTESTDEIVDAVLRIENFFRGTVRELEEDLRELLEKEDHFE